MTSRAGAGVVLVLGAVAVGAATTLGSASDVLDAVVHPPTIVRAGLIGLSVTIAVVLLTRSVARMSEGTSDVPAMIRGVRFAFLAIAALAAAFGWALASALPLLVALVIAGIDVVETSFLLVVVGPERP